MGGHGGPRPGPQDRDQDPSKLYVAYLPHSLGDNELRGLFAPYGTVVEAKVICDRATGVSRGFGFVTMGNPQEAQTAVQVRPTYTQPRAPPYWLAVRQCFDVTECFRLFLVFFFFLPRCPECPRLKLNTTSACYFTRQLT
jgi:hypothetical protein